MKLRSLILAACMAFALSPAVHAQSALKALDTDKDGTIDLAEAKAAAGALFDKLDKDHDGTLDRKELHGRIADKDWKVADPDNDKTISRDEYMAFVERAFRAANPDKDGTLDARELKTPAGEALLKLVR